MEQRGFLLQKPLLPLRNWAKLADELKRLYGPAEAERRPVTRMISVIIPAHNEEAYLGATLEALRNQSYGWFEVIVVVNGCTDRTAEIARGRCHRLIVLSQKSLGVARNLGARMARGEILLFLDADTLLEPMTLRRIAEDFTRDCSTGTVRGAPDQERLSYKMIYGFKNLVHSAGLHPGSSGVILCWKDHFVQMGGFDEGLEVRENSELMRRLRNLGRYRYIGDITARTSMRRYERRGVPRLACLWLRLWLQSIFGDLHQRHYEPIR